MFIDMRLPNERKIISALYRSILSAHTQPDTSQHSRLMNTLLQLTNLSIMKTNKWKNLRILAMFIGYRV